MKPRDLLLDGIDRYLVAPLTALGFRYVKSRIAFSRKSGIATQSFGFSLDRWNSQDDCSFWTMWEASAASYGKWHEEQFDERLTNTALGCEPEWIVPGWSRTVAERACLRNHPADAIVIGRLLQDIARAGIPFLDSISTWKGAAQRLVRCEGFVHRAVDFFLLADDHESARDTLLAGIQWYSGGWPDQMSDLPELYKRLAKFFPNEKSIAPT